MHDFKPSIDQDKMNIPSQGLLNARASAELSQFKGKLIPANVHQQKPSD